ncbi:rCG38013, isoform CRA_a [Rattus norvegicus]|uniref:RCG38013, isoform CRA_a n=1 Tax=Rattus norvegicus TaxID=10116 RepID=A6IVF9_RAT|nr:rCG38013, isoform CRA_a [Rattus norvegicus]
MVCLFLDTVAQTDLASGNHKCVCATTHTASVSLLLIRYALKITGFWIFPP